VDGWIKGSLDPSSCLSRTRTARWKTTRIEKGAVGFRDVEKWKLWSWNRERQIAQGRHSAQVQGESISQPTLVWFIC